MTTAPVDRPYKPPGRRPIGRRVDIRLDLDTLAAVDRKAAERGVSRAAVLRELVNTIHDPSMDGTARIRTPMKFEERLLTELEDKEYRDAFVEGHIRTGAAYQIRALRNARHWSQEELGTHGDMTQSVIARLENSGYGKFSLTTLLKLASAFDVALLVQFVSFSELLGRTRDLSPEGLNAPSYADDPMLPMDEANPLENE